MFLRLLLLTVAMSPKLFAGGLHWDRLSDLPDSQGFAGAFVGVSDGALLFAGGANVVGDLWADPLNKKWTDRAFVFEKSNRVWQVARPLTQPKAYGVSVTTSDGVACLGCCDETHYFTESFLLRWRHNTLEYDHLPDLPMSCAYGCGALVGHTIYVAGGQQTPSSTEALHTFWALDLTEKPLRWRSLEPWPGPARILGVSGVSGDTFFLFSGASLSADPLGRPKRTYLVDAYAFSIKSGWRRLADLPRPAVAAPSPAFPTGRGEILVVSGDDGEDVAFQPLRDHPGFPRNILRYSIERDAWTKDENCPLSRATAPTAVWDGDYVIPNGEVRPRVRTPQVWTLHWSGSP